MYPAYVKRFMDFMTALVALIILSPLFIVVIIILVLAFRGNPFFIQCRPGYMEKPIYVIKFKSMSDQKDTDGNLLPNHLRITRVGRFLRNYSIDELPQLINVLKADMSWVGPRPLLYKYIPLYSESQRKRMLVKPGITGLAQVNGRNTISWTKKFEYDSFYVENISFLLDVKIFLKTIKTVFTIQDVNAGETTTMPPFNGKN